MKPSKTTVKIHPNTELDIITRDTSPSLENLINGTDEVDNWFFDYDKAAIDLLESFEEESCVAFLEALHKAAACKIVEHWKRFSPERLEEERYKKYLVYEK